MSDNFIDQLINDIYAEQRKVEEAKQLLKEAVEFMNLVPNNTITYKGEIDVYEDAEDTINHYELCSKIDEFLKEKIIYAK